MVSYVIRRVLAMIPALVGIALITFILMHMTEGGPFTTEHADPEVVRAQMRAYHLDEPILPTFMGSNADAWKTGVLILGLALLLGVIVLYMRKWANGSIIRPALPIVGVFLLLWYVGMAVQDPGIVQADGFVNGQFLRYLGNLARFDLGTSFSLHRPINDILANAIPNSFILGITAFVLLVGMALPLGIIAALRQNTWVDYLASGISLVGYSIPNFVMGIFLLLLTGVWLKLIPIAAWETHDILLGPIALSLPNPRDLILPAVVLAIRPLAVLTRLTRASMIDVLNQDYIRTAWAKGLKARPVVMRHGLRNALLPVVTVMGDHLGDLVTGSIAVEYLFNVPGIGQKFVESVSQRDYGMIMGTTLFYAFLVLAINLVVDMMYAVIDPRIKLGAGARS